MAPRQQHPSIPLRPVCTSCDHGKPSVLGLVLERRVEPRIAKEIGRVRKVQKSVTLRHWMHMAAGHEVQVSCSEVAQPWSGNQRHGGYARIRVGEALDLPHTDEVGR